jgi:Zn-dependent M28 family amino/carboxypeptidase
MVAPMKPIVPLALLSLLAALPVRAQTPTPRAEQWWADIKAIADDRTEGRQTGSRGYDLAADYVISRFKALGLQPAGENGGFLQPVGFEQQRIDYAASSAALIGPGGAQQALKAGADMLITAGGAPRPSMADAPLVFIGYGLHLPELGYDDLKGLDLKGKIAVVISGGPAEIPGTVKASNRNQRAKFLTEAGAVGVLALTTPKQVEIPWARQTLLATQLGMYLADASMRQTPDGFFQGSFDPGQTERLFAGSGHTFAELAALADASAAVPAFALPFRLKATIAAQRQKLTSPNLVAKLEGSDPALKSEYVVVSAHLDHLGVGEPIAGDRIYNGAMDDASGVAAVLDIAGRLKGEKPRRSVLFVMVTAEEKGLLGSHYFARRPTVPRSAIVADLNFDMPLPLWTLKTVIVGGEGESTLGAVAREAAGPLGLATTPDPLPDRNSFTRTDQYSFVTAGVPSLAFKFGFRKDTPEFQIEHDWRANRYHSPSDDVNQPGVMKEEAVKLDDFVASIALRTANAAGRPSWLESSVFRRFSANPEP